MKRSYDGVKKGAKTSGTQEKPKALEKLAETGKVSNLSTQLHDLQEPLASSSMPKVENTVKPITDNMPDTTRQHTTRMATRRLSYTKMESSHDGQQKDAKTSGTQEKPTAEEKLAETGKVSDLITQPHDLQEPSASSSMSGVASTAKPITDNMPDTTKQHATRMATRRLLHHSTDIKRRKYDEPQEGRKESVKKERPDTQEHFGESSSVSHFSAKPPNLQEPLASSSMPKVENTVKPITDNMPDTTRQHTTRMATRRLSYTKMESSHDGQQKDAKTSGTQEKPTAEEKFADTGKVSDLSTQPHDLQETSASSSMSGVASTAKPITGNMPDTTKQHATRMATRRLLHHSTDIKRRKYDEPQEGRKESVKKERPDTQEHFGESSSVSHFSAKPPDQKKPVMSSSSMPGVASTSKATFTYLDPATSQMMDTTRPYATRMTTTGTVEQSAGRKFDPTRLNDESKVSEDKKSDASDSCDTCHQLLKNLRIHVEKNENVATEKEALKHHLLNSNPDNKASNLIQETNRTTHKITAFVVYDKKKHLCRFDTGLIEEENILFFSGYIKPIFDDSPSIEGGVLAKDIGPINEWWLVEDKEILLGFSTKLADYYLMEASPSYLPLMSNIIPKVYTKNAVIAFLEKNINKEHSYEDLLTYLQDLETPNDMIKIDEHFLLSNAEFIYNQLENYFLNETKNKIEILNWHVMRKIIKLSGIQITTGINAETFSKAITPLVQYIFEEMLKNEINVEQQDCSGINKTDSSTEQQVEKDQSPKKDETKGLEQEETIENDDLDDEVQSEICTDCTVSPTQQLTLGQWQGTVDNIYNIYAECRFLPTSETLLEIHIHPGDFVMLRPSNKMKPSIIARVHYMMENEETHEKICHVQIFIRARNTVLGETACRNEIMQLEECHTVSLYSIEKKLRVIQVRAPKDWALLGGTTASSIFPFSDAEKDVYWYQKYYNKNNGQLMDIPADPENKELKAQHRYCSCCERKIHKNLTHKNLFEPLTSKESDDKVMYRNVTWNDKLLTVGSCILIKTSAYQMPLHIDSRCLDNSSAKNAKERKDHIKFPESYRKKSNKKGSNENTPQPFNIGRIISISKDKISGNIVLKVGKFYRPENIPSVSNAHKIDFNQLYWSSEVCDVDFNDVEGHCFVINVNSKIITSSSLLDWTQGGPHRFYFAKAYINKIITEPPKEAAQFGFDVNKIKSMVSKGKRKQNSTYLNAAKAPPWSKIEKPLRCFDIFAGCGGLSEGLHQSGAAVTEWAVEMNHIAARSFELNHPSSQVFAVDSNELLKKIMKGEKILFGQKLPQRGEVEMICGGPPCQGFSSMNRFNSRENSVLKNCLILTFLSYCEYFRPRIFILENVRNFVSYNQGMFLKLALNCLNTMGYQTSFGILQSGNFGVPQTRNRLFLMAAAPGEILPDFPEPLHVFSPRACRNVIKIDNRSFLLDRKWQSCAPLRTVTVQDILSDLPEIANGENSEELDYDLEPQSHVQKMARRRCNSLSHHICKLMSALDMERIKRIPPGGDWTDLPNIQVDLPDGTKTVKLNYISRKGTSHVCPCFGEKSCSGKNKQKNTIIPWYLSHTANRNNDWVGSFGRTENTGFLSTTVTDVDPKKKQGQVLHPTQNRVLSVRECARSQGFHDSYQFVGNIQDKYRQIGNAVTVPVATAIGRKIVESLNRRETP